MGQWLEKNKDPLNDTLVGVLKKGTGNPLTVTVWGTYKTQEEQLAEEKGMHCFIPFITIKNVRQITKKAILSRNWGIKRVIL